jgi:hypothetical protein
MPWMYVFIPVYVMFMVCALSGTFYITWLYVFYHAFASYMFYDHAGIHLLSWFDTYNHVDHAYEFWMNIYDAMMLLLVFSYDIIMIQLFFRIKLTWKLSKYLIIQKLNIRQFSLNGFAAALKLNPFDGKNFMIWCARMELWLTAMSCYHVAQGRPENLAPEDESKFRLADNLFPLQEICHLMTFMV